jgi:hypothetical protein
MSPNYVMMIFKMKQLLRYKTKTQEFRTNQNSWDESLVIDKNRLEEEPEFDPICIENQPYISIHTSSHQAAWILTRNDIRELNHSCNFLAQWYDPNWKNSGMVREYMSSLSIYRSKKVSSVLKIIFLLYLYIILFPLRNTWFVTRPLNCMVSKVLPATKVETFKIRHYYRSKDSKQTSKPIFEADELTRRGIDYTSPNEAIKKTYPTCWKQVLSDAVS